MKRKFIRKGKFWVYILECGDGTYYTGYTPDLEKRVKLHNDGKGAKYTKGRLPVKLIWQKGYQCQHYAMGTECNIKKLSRRQKDLLVGGMRLDKVLNGKNNRRAK